MGWAGNAMLRPLYTRERELALVLQETVWALGPVWMGAVNLCHANT